MKRIIALALIGVPSIAYGHLTIHGPKVQVGNGFARTYISLKAKALPKEIGIEFNASALDGLAETDQEFYLKFPLFHKVRPFKHVVVNWNPHGHEPDGVYGAPHFDFHFYLIPRSIQAAIKCSGEDEAICMKQPEADFIPDQYVPTPAGVPTMGWHWLDPTSPEFNGQPFTKTFIYGFYNGKINFLEPMITLDYLKSMPSAVTTIPQPKKFSECGRYPEKYGIEFDSIKNVYRVSLRDLKLAR